MNNIKTKTKINFGTKIALTDGRAIAYSVLSIYAVAR